jgi:hypothetical protein
MCGAKYPEVFTIDQAEELASGTKARIIELLTQTDTLTIQEIKKQIIDTITAIDKRLHITNILLDEKSLQAHINALENQTTIKNIAC